MKRSGVPLALVAALGLAGCGLNANDPYLDAPVVSLEEAPPPIQGGTLLATRDGRRAVMSDPDRHRLVVVDLESRAVREVPLDRGVEPGRLIEDGVGRVYVALRQGGAVLAIDPAVGAPITRHEVCASPRGLAWDETGDRVHVACADGTLATLGPDRTVERSITLPPDLRDVLVTPEALLVTRHRSAEVLRVSPSPVSEPLPIAALAGVDEDGRESGLVQRYAPGVAVRLAATPRGAVLLHQRARIGEEAVFEGSTRPRTRYTYSNEPVSNDEGETWRDPCENAVVHAAATFLAPDGRVLNVASPVRHGVVPVDIAVSPGGRVAIAFAGEPGGTYALGPQVASTTLALAMADPEPAPSDCLPLDETPTFEGQVVAVAFSGERRLVQLREPATLVVEDEAIPLGGASVRDTGHDIFHLDTGGAIACASCHPGGGDDGHVWQFSATGEVRTPPLQGMIGLTPYHRAGNVPSFSALMTSLQEQMAGPQLQDDALAAAQRWLVRLPDPATGPVLDPDAVARGRAIFEREDVGCASCHTGELGTDGQSHYVGDGTWQTPPLRGAALRPPYLHDGRAPTLSAALDVSGHGRTDHLDGAERADLEAYLESR